MFAPVARQQAEEARQMDVAARDANYRPAPAAATRPVNTARLSHRKVLCYYIPLCLAAAVTVVLSVAAATVPMTITNTTHVLFTAWGYPVNDSITPAESARLCCGGTCSYPSLAYSSYVSEIKRSLPDPNNIVFAIPDPYVISNCTAMSIAEFQSEYNETPVVENLFKMGLTLGQISSEEGAVAIVERKASYNVPFTLVDVWFYGVDLGNSLGEQSVSLYSCLNMEYETYNTYVKPVDVDKRRVVTSPISTWHSLAELTTMIALAISGCIFAFAWGQVSELDALYELEQTTANAVTLTSSDQYSVLGTAFGSSEELVENPYGSALYTKSKRRYRENERDGDEEEEDDGGSVQADAHGDEFSDDGYERGSPVDGDQESPLSSPTQLCRPTSPPPEPLPAGPEPSTVAVQIGTAPEDASAMPVMHQQGGREEGESATDGGTAAHEPSSPTAVRAIPISRTRITRMRRLRDLIRQYQLARVRQLALLDCVLLVVSFFLFINTFTGSEELDESVSMNLFFVSITTPQSVYTWLRVWCCGLSALTFALTIAIVHRNIW